MKRVVFFVAFVALFSCAPMAHTQGDRAAQIRLQVQQTIERLELTDEQIERFLPVVERSLLAQKELMAKYGLDPESRQAARPDRKTLKALRAEMEALRANTLAELEGILSDTQLTALIAIQEERRAAMQSRMRDSR